MVFEQVNTNRLRMSANRGCTRSFFHMSTSSLHIERAIEILRQGGVVVFPTETAYGLAADATNARAVERVMTIKGREEWKTPPLIAADQAMIEKYCTLSPIMRALVAQFWPGPLTLVCPVSRPGLETTECAKHSKNSVFKARPWGLVEGVVRDGMVAIRMSSHPTAHALSKELGAPIVATSANVAGEPECYDVACVKKQFVTYKLQPDFYLDEGPLEKRLPSTLVKEEKGKLIVLRQGEIEIPKRYVA